MSIVFTEEMIAGAKATERETGVPASITLGQLVLESGYKSPDNMSSLAKDYNNFFGVTKGSYKGDTVYMTNSAGTDGKFYRVYNSVEEGFKDHAKVVSQYRYTSKLKGTGDYRDYAQALQAGGYATDKEYANKLINVIESYNLSAYDGTGSAITTQTAVVTADMSNDNILINAVENIFLFVVIFLVIVIAVISFLKAFNVSTVTIVKNKVKNKTMKGVQNE